MKHIIIFILTIFSLTITSCKKEEVPVIKTYNLEFKSHHWWTYTSSTGIGMSSGYYGFSVFDENFNSIWDKSGTIQNQTVSFTTTAKSGQSVSLYIAPYDVYDAISANLYIDGQSTLYLFEDNSLLYDYESYDLKCINGKEYIVKEIKLP
jgi:hypothetical protein